MNCIGLIFSVMIGGDSPIILNNRHIHNVRLSEELIKILCKENNCDIQLIL
jgi:hypothetical protein